MKVRIEVDSLGEYPVPFDAYYGSQTARSINNFKITYRSTHPTMIRALGMIKKAAAITNNQLGYLTDEKLKYIKAACDEVINGLMDSQFKTDIIQGGAGTSMNMNANEVIANRANELAGYPLGSYSFIHPNDDINFSQSTNDVFPTAGRMTCIYLIDGLLAEMRHLRQVLLAKANEFDKVIKVGRTHLQDAVPITLGQEFRSYAWFIKRDIHRISTAFKALRAINMGATAVGTGLNADERYAKLVVETLSNISGIDLISIKDLVDGTRHTDPFVWAHGALKTFCVSLSKMCNDLRLMASGPIAGLNEINLPAKQPGSSIMPGKVNPVILEVCNQVCFQVFGNDVTITKASEAGQLELNVFEPVLFANLFQSIEILANAITTLRDNCISDISANVEHNQHMVDLSLGQATALAPVIGYKQASQLAKQALKENKKLKQLILDNNIFTAKELEKILNLKKMTRPGIAGKRKNH